MNTIRKKYGQEAIELVREVIGPGRRVGSLIGSGSYGEVYNLICTQTSKCDRVIKIQYNKYETIRSEIRSQQHLASYDLAPHIFCSDAIMSENTGNKAFVVIVMEKIDGVLYELLKQPLSFQSLQDICDVIYDIIIKLCAIESIHGDFHLENIGYVITGSDKIRFMLIDFGFSQTETGCNPRLEITQLLRSLKILKGLDAGNVEFIHRYFIRKYETSYGEMTNGANTLWKRFIGRHLRKLRN